MSASLMLSRQLSRLKGRGVSLVAILHDVEILRGAKRKNKSIKNRMRKHFEEQLCLGHFDRIVVHNKAMKEAVADLCGIPAGKMRSLGLFDYLCGETRSREFGRGVAVAGNLRPDKSGYAYQLPGNMRWNLYGIQFSGKAFLPGDETDPKSPGVYYHGSFLADEIADRIDGSFGLVWDGTGLGTDGTSWGAECLIGDFKGFEGMNHEYYLVYEFDKNRFKDYKDLETLKRGGNLKPWFSSVADLLGIDA